MSFKTKQILIFILSLTLTFVVLRVSLFISPNSNFDVAGYNIHHLYTGLVILTLAVVPMMLFSHSPRIVLPATLLFGIGLSMALDEWVYLIATDGSDASYLLPVSFWGGVIAIGLTCVYALVVWAFSHRCSIKQKGA